MLHSINTLTDRLTVATGGDLLDRLAEGTADDAAALDADTLDVRAVGRYVPSADFLATHPGAIPQLLHNVTTLTAAQEAQIAALQSEIAALRERVGYMMYWNGAA